jgi:mRNA-degrading endonuclease RelE of RelBE toxin-antitoxin system
LIFVIADTFQKSLANLDGQAQALVKQKAFDFQANPANPGFQFHRLEKSKDKNFWSVRVNAELRLIVHKTKDSVALCYVGHHDPAYAWAEVRKLEVHPQTGAAQFVEIRERVEEVVKQVVREVEAEAPLFAQYEERYLLALGVPQAWLAAVRKVGSKGFERLGNHLPTEAYERLFSLACGEPVPTPEPTAPDSQPFAHPDAQRRFRVLDNQDELRRALDFPWEQWIVFLHPAQRSVVERRSSGPGKVYGGAGTGKSIVAMHRAAHLARAGEGPVLLTTYSKTLAARLEQAIGHLLPLNDPARGRLTVRHLHRVAVERWNRHAPKPFVAAKTDDVLLALDKSLRRSGTTEFPVSFLRAEWDAIVDAWGIATWPEYKAFSRAGRATPLGAKQRLQLWHLFEGAREELRLAGRTTWSQLCHDVAGVASSDPPFRHVVADEVQDFGAAELTLLRALAPSEADDLLVCGDAGQRIFVRPIALARVGIDIRGRSTRLKVNYRTTDEIRSFADRFVAKVDEGEGSETERTTLSLLHGPAPIVIGHRSIDAEITGLAKWIRDLQGEGYQPGEIGIFARSDSLLRERVEPALRELGLVPHPLRDEAPPTVKDVATGTMHRAKGLEFKAVAVVGCDYDVLPPAYVLREQADDADREEQIEQERQLLYVAATRARERLLLSHTGKATRFLRDGA